MDWLCAIGWHRWRVVQKMEYGDVMPDGTGMRYVTRWYGRRECVRCGKITGLFDDGWDPHTGKEL